MRQRASLWSTASLRRVAQIAAAVVTSMGCIVLIGWILDIHLLRSWLPGIASMKANTAVGAVLAGTALFSAAAVSPRQRLVGRICSLVVLVIGATSLSQYLLGWDLGIDELLFPEIPDPIATIYPGRMSLPSAVCFVLVGSALWLSGTHNTPSETSTKARWVEVLALLSSFIAAQGLIAYFYEVRPIIGFVPFTQMALSTAIAFLVLGIGILCLHPHQGWMGIVTADSAGGTIARRLLPAAIAIPLILGWLRIESARIGWLEPNFGTSILVVLNVIIFLALIGWNARLLHRVDLQRQSAVQALHQANEALEARVSDRTTELRDVNQRLRQSEERLNLAIEGSGLGMVDLDLQTGRGIWSAQYFRLLGYDPTPSGEATSELWQDRVHPDDLAGVMQVVHQTQQAQTMLNLEHRVIRADNGQVAWLRVFGRYFYNPTGQATRFIGVIFDNTSQRQVQEERDRFFMLSLDMLCIAGLDGYFKQLNPAWERVLGYTQAELMAEPFFHFVHPDDQAKTRLEANKHASGAPAIHFENRYRCKDGSYKWIEWTAVPAVESKLLYAVARDITERKQAEQQLERQAATLQQQANLLELVYEPIMVRNLQGEITYWNRGAEATYGWSSAEALGQVSHKLLHTQLAEPEDDLDAKILQQEHWQGELIHTCKENQQIVVESRQVLIRDQQGLPTGFLEVNLDITDRKRAETTLRNLNQELQRSLTESQALLEVIPIGIAIAEDPECRRIRINSAFAKHMGFTTEDNISLSAGNEEAVANYRVYRNGQTLEPDQLPLQYAAAHGVEVLGMELDVVLHDGKTLTLLGYAAPLFDEIGNSRGSVGAFLDITERKQAEAEITQLNATLEQRVEQRTAQLREANQELEAFSYTVAHDLRAPLRGVQGFSQALVEDYGDRLDDLARSYIQRIFDSTERMNALIHDLLAYSRLSRETVRLTAVHLSYVMAEAQAQLQDIWGDRSIDITVAEPLPIVLGYRSLLVQILVNLLSNAVKFVAPAKQPQIRVWAEVKGEWVRLWVEDNGIGIEPQYQEQIFGVFERLHGMDSYPGTGIGLAIVRKGTERLGGKTGVESTFGQGSRFWVELQRVIV